MIGVQFNCVKEMMNLPDVAEGFQRAEITALIYDPRTTGLSDGMPRNDIDSMKQVEDYSDALTFLGDHPMVDRNQMAFWGGIFCWHGVTVRCVSRQESQACYCCLPIRRDEYTPELLPKVLAVVLAKCMKDWESQLKGNPPFYLPMINEQGRNPAGLGVGMDKISFSESSTLERTLC